MPTTNRLTPPPRLSVHSPVRWVGSDRAGLPLKRKQVAQACDACRRRKKRCTHTEDGPGPTAAAAAYPPPTTTTTTGPPPSDDEADATQVAANRLIELASARFISDMNPEGMFIQAASPALPATGTSYRDSNDLGVWLPGGRARRRGKHSNGSDGSGKGSAMDSDSDDGADDDGENDADNDDEANPDASLPAAARRYARSRHAFVKACLAERPPPADFAVLHRIYCEKVHPLFPVLKDTELAATGPGPAGDDNDDDVFLVLVRQIIAMAAAMTDAAAAAPHMRLGPRATLLAPRAFHRRLTDALLFALEADAPLAARLPRMDYIRALILVSFFYQPSAAADVNRPALLCTLAIHHFHTLGAHLLGYRAAAADDDVDRTFCALWALDRLSALLYARPCMLHDCDNGKNAEDCAARQPACFRLFLSVILWLDKVINLYRPRQPFVLVDIPVYEALILDAKAERLPAMFVGTIEVLYHTVCVLSCRQPSSVFAEPPDTNGRAYLPLSIMNPRRSHSSDRIVWVTQTQPICFFPYVPFAVSIALSVQYKKMRYSRTPIFRTRSRAGFRDVVALLKSMGDVFHAARVSTALGERIWAQMERTASSLVDGDKREEARDGDDAASHVYHTPPQAPANEPHQADNNDDGPHADMDDVDDVDDVDNADNPHPHDGPSSTHGLPTQGPSPPLPHSPAQAPAHAPAHAPTHGPLLPPLPPASGPEYLTLVLPQGPPQGPPQGQPPPPVDLSVLDTDIDLFGNFDPSFDLGAIDTALEANLDMGIPQQWTWNSIV